jgi:galactose mutarotase-like enzyme
MFTVTPRNDALETLELRDTDSKSLAVLAPSRGGMMTRLSLLGKHALFLDESTLRDATKNVRGGNPVLFPTPGKLENDRWERDRKNGYLKQHGFARNLAWDVAGTSTETAASATLRLASTDVTRKDYPWDFLCEYTYALRGNVLRIEQTFENRGAAGSAAMPFGAGFHPYFHVKQSDKAAARIGTKATKAFDNVTKKNIALSGHIDLAFDEVDLHLIDHGAEPCTLSHGDRLLTLRGSPEFSRWVIWTLTGKDFVCVEPWTCPGNAMNTGESLLTLQPGEKKTIWVEIEATR